MGIHPHWPHGTILFFDTLEHARYARAKFVLEGNKCGRYAMNAELSEDGTKIVIDGVAEDFEKK